MAEKTVKIIQVSVEIVEGRRFNTTSSFVVRACMGSDVLESTEHAPCSSPALDVTFVWRLPAIPINRVRHSTAKVELYSCQNWERIGFVNLSLREVHRKPHYSWHSLADTHGSGSSAGPEIKMGFQVEITTGLECLRCKIPASTCVVNAKNGFIQIGPHSDYDDVFLFCIHPSSADYLDVLIPPNLRTQYEDFYFSYKFLNSSIVTQTLMDITHKSDKGKVWINLHGSLLMIKNFLESYLVTLELKCREQKIAFTKISIHPLLSAEAHSTNGINTVINNYFLMRYYNRRVPRKEDGCQPFVTVEMLFKYAGICALSGPDPVPTFLTGHKITEDQDEQNKPTNQMETTVQDATNDTDVQDIDDCECGKANNLHQEHLSKMFQLKMPAICSNMPDNAAETSLTEDQPQIATMQAIKEDCKPCIAHVNQINSGLTPESTSAGIGKAYHNYCLHIMVEKAEFYNTDYKGKLYMRIQHPKAKEFTNSHVEFTISENNNIVYFENIKYKLHYIATTNKIWQIIYIWPPIFTISKSSWLHTKDVVQSIPIFKNKAYISTYNIVIQNTLTGEKVGTMAVSMYVEDLGISKMTDWSSVPHCSYVGPQITLHVTEEVEQWMEQQQSHLSAKVKMINSSEGEGGDASELSKEDKVVNLLDQLMSQFAEGWKNLRMDKHKKHNETLKHKQEEEMFKDIINKNKTIQLNHKKYEKKLTLKLANLERKLFSVLEKIEKIDKSNASLIQITCNLEREVKDLKKYHPTSKQLSRLLNIFILPEKKPRPSIKARLNKLMEYEWLIRKAYNMNYELVYEQHLIDFGMSGNWGSKYNLRRCRTKRPNITVNHYRNSTAKVSCS